jgi:hypothetical protein
VLKGAKSAILDENFSFLTVPRLPIDGQKAHDGID